MNLLHTAGIKFVPDAGIGQKEGFRMKNDDPIFQNPLTHLGYDTEDIIPLGGFGAVVARAGVGNTS